MLKDSYKPGIRRIKPPIYVYENPLCLKEEPYLRKYNPNFKIPCLSLGIQWFI